MIGLLAEAAANRAQGDVVSLLAAAVAQVGLAIPSYLLYPVLMLIVAIVIVGFISVFDLFAVWLERKVSARIQCRLGPMEVGPIRGRGGRILVGGVLQTIADGVKLLAKEDIVPWAVDKVLFIVGPMIVFLGVFAIYAVLPFGPQLVPSDLNLGIFYVAAIGSLEAIGVIMAGWASNNKWSLFGTMRAATQVVSYEIPLGLTFATIILMTGSLSLIDICNAQRGLFLNWFIFANPFTFLAFFIYNIAALAEAKRAPFDLPEAESELVCGYHTEYSGMRFAIFFLSEYGAMYVAGALAAVLFLGGYYWGVPFLSVIDNTIYEGGILGNLLGLFSILVKSLVIVYVQMWLRWTLPRVRLDQIMHLCLKVLLPFGIACMVGAAAWQLAVGDHTLLFLPRWCQ
ncbi:NADH-quinone oxidoreductase subunit NuoH [Planctomycetota bacterium]